MLLGEGHVPFIISRYTHDGSGAVVGKDILSFPHGNLFLGSRIRHILSGKLICFTRNYEESGATNSIGTSSENFYVIELDESPFRLPNPVSLLGFDTFWIINGF